MSIKKLVPRGFLTICILKQLKNGPKHGYDMMKSLEKETGWEPSPGAVYPTLYELKERGLITKIKKKGDRKIFYKLTKDGKRLVHDLEGRMNEMKGKFGDYIGVVGQIVGMNQSELMNLMKKHKVIPKSGLIMLSPKIKEYMIESRGFILKIARNKTKYKKLIKILNDTRQKLKILSGESFD